MDAAISTDVEVVPARNGRQELGALLKLAWPLALAQAGNALMGVVDTAVVGRLSATAQGAVGIGNGLFFFWSVLGMGVLMALDPLVSQAVGAGDRPKARTLYWQGVWLSLLATGVLFLPMVLSPLALEAVGVDRDVARGAMGYVWWRSPSLASIMLFSAARSYLQGLGRPLMMFIATIVANVLNLGLDVAFVFGIGPIPAMGAEGSALATALCSWAQFLLLLLAFDPRPAAASRAFVWPELKKAFLIGLPIGLQVAAEVGVFALVGVLAGRMSPASVAAHQVAITWASFSFCLALGVGSAAAVRVGWAVGAKDTPSARRSGLMAFAVGACIMSASAVFFLLVPEVPARLMTDQSDVLAAVVALFGVCAVFQIFDGIQAVGAGALRGAGDTRFSFWANVVGHYGIGLPVALWLGIKLNLGVVGLWWGLCAGLISVALALFLRFVTLTKQSVRAL